MQNRHKHFIQKRLEFFVGRSRLSMFGVLITEPPTPPGIITSHIHHNIGFVLRHTSAENEELCGRATATVPSSRPACNDDICGDNSDGITKSSDKNSLGGITRIIVINVAFAISPRTSCRHVHATRILYHCIAVHSTKL